MFCRQLNSRPHGQLLEGTGAIVLRRIVVVLDILIRPNRFLFFTGVGSLVLPTTLRIAVAVFIIFIIFIIRKIAVPKHHLLFHIFQPLATQCLHRPPDEIFSTPKWDYIIDVFPSSSSGVDLGYCAKSRAMFSERVQGLRYVLVEPFGTLGRGDD